MASVQLKAWELENAVKLVDPQLDSLYSYDNDEQKAIADKRPWKKDPNHFKRVRISAVALLKMVMHARSGGAIEVMGLMQGKVQGDSFIVTDAFRLPVEGTETRVNASDEANTYIVQYLQSCRDNGLLENAVGWYHSHPGYGCWLSGIDVSTQATQQQYQDPFLAVVVDPDRTVSAGKVEIGAFRTYPEGYKQSGGSGSDRYESIPVGKTEDFGAHADRYYSLEVQHYKSSLDTELLDRLWHKYWVSTLSQSPLVTSHRYTTKQIVDLAQKVRIAEKMVNKSGGLGGGFGTRASIKDTQIDNIVNESRKIAGEEERGIVAEEIKAKLFTNVTESSS